MSAARLHPHREPGPGRRVPPELVDDLVLERDGRRLVHGPFPRGTGADLGIAWPRTPLPASTPRAAGPAPLRVVDESGAPIAKAEVHVTGRPGEDSVTSTDADGRAQVALPARGRVRICASADGFGEACLDASTRSSEPLELRLPKMERREARFVDPDTGAPLRATAVRLRGADGVVRELPPPEGGFDRVDVTWPRTRLAGASGGRGRRPPARACPPRHPVRDPVGAGGPDPRADGRRPPGPRVGPHPRRGPLGDGARPRAERGRPRDGAHGHGPRRPRERSVPKGRATEVVVEPTDAAPVGVSVAADTSGPVTAPLAAGVELVIRVATADGKPVAGANVVALARAGKATVRRRALTGDDGTATLPPVAEGRLEVYAHRAGFAWAVVTVDARPGGGETRLVLSPGHRLRLVVEDPDGLPLAGVAVRSVARADTAAGAPDPMDPDGLPWTTDADGVLRVEDLPDREVDLYLGRAGYGEEIVARVRPGATTWFATLVRAKR